DPPTGEKSTDRWENVNSAKPRLLADGPAGRDLRPAGPAIPRAQPVVERQPGLLRLPAPRHPRRYRLPAIDFHSEALETQRAGTIVVAFGVLGTETVARFALPAAGAPRPRRHARGTLV